VSEAKRNATVTMKPTDVLLRTFQKDFAELLREPLLHRISAEEARDKVANGAQWVDVRYPSEYQYDKLAGANQISRCLKSATLSACSTRKRIRVLLPERATQRRRGISPRSARYRAFLLEGGLWGQAKRRA